MSSLKRDGDILYCSKCRMRQMELWERCHFCGELFDNYEELLIENSRIREEDKVKENNISF